MTEAHRWEFKARFRSRAFGWKSQPAITRIKQAVTEIKKVAKNEPVVAAEGAVVFLERVSARQENLLTEPIDREIARPTRLVSSGRGAS